MNEETMKVMESLMEMGMSYTIDIMGALIILIVGWVVAGWAGRLTQRAIRKIPKVDTTVAPVAASFVKYTVLAFVIVAVLAQFGVETTSILAVFGAAGLAIGLALQGTLSNIAAGIMLLVLRPFSIGDFIDGGGISGTVEEIGLFTTRFKTAAGLFVLAPNSSLWGSTITNYSRNPQRRIDLIIGVAYEDDIDGAMAEMQALMESDDRMLKDPAPQVFVTELADSSVNMTLQCWVNTSDYWQTFCDLTRNAKLRLDKEGYSIPFPQREIHMASGSAPQF